MFPDRFFVKKYLYWPLYYWPLRKFIQAHETIIVEAKTKLASVLNRIKEIVAGTISKAITTDSRTKNIIKESIDKNAVIDSRTKNIT